MSAGLPWEARVALAACSALGGRVYGPGVGARKDTTTNCCIAVEAVLVELYGRRVLEEHSALMVMDASQPYSPVEACVRLGIGREVPHPEPGCWHVVQGWRELDGQGWVPSPSPVPNGHTFMWWEPPVPITGPGVLVNANTSRPWVRRLTWGEAAGPYRAGVELAALVPA